MLSEFYAPTTRETTRFYQTLVEEIERLLLAAADDHTLTATPDVVHGAAQSIIEHLRNSDLTNDQKIEEINDILDTHITPDQLVKLQGYANQLHDYQTKSLDSESSTLATGVDPATTKPEGQGTLYPDPESITEDNITAHTFTGLDVPPLDLLIRTSGVERLSDFMLWQCHQDTEIIFVNCFWPEFGLKHLLPIILEWQWKVKKEQYWAESGRRPSKLE